MERLIADTYDVCEKDAGAFGPDTHEHAYVVAKLRESGLDFLRGGRLRSLSLLALHLALHPLPLLDISMCSKLIDTHVHTHTHTHTPAHPRARTHTPLFLSNKNFQIDPLHLLPLYSCALNAHVHA